mgnify:CR=1 FL=1
MVKSTSATGLLPDLHKRLRDTMITCPQFRSNEELRTAFVDARIRPWRDTLPQAANIDSRVRGIINYLYERRNTEGKNALVLCLQVLGECVDPGDALCSELLALADEVEAYLKIGQAKHVSSPPVTKSLTDQKLTPIPTNVVPDVTCKVDMVGLRAELERYDAVQIESLCLDHFSQVYDKFGRGLRRDEMTNLLLDYVRRRPEEAGRLSKLLVHDVPQQQFSIPVQDVPQQQFSIPETVLIPAGEFWMGNNDDDPDARPNEMPRHKLSLPAYEIGKYPVTNAQYHQFVREAGHHPPAHWIDGEIPADKENHPVVCVSFMDAQAYCNWLSGKTSCNYRLPSEQEWEKAARGSFPDDRRYPWGSGWYRDYCNTNETGSGDTTPVTVCESINKSPFGVVDMAGNVWEWTSSVYTRYGNTVSSSDSFAGLKYTVRGGAYTIEARSARISCRGRYGPHEYKPYLGFRVVINIGLE